MTGIGGGDTRGSAGGLEYGVTPAGYRLPGGLRIGRVSLRVADLARSIAFYREVLGMEVLAREGDRARLGVSDGTPLVELREWPGAAPVPRRGRIGLYHFAILLPDRAALGRFVAHLGERGVTAGASDHLVSEAIYLHDPDGLGIEVSGDRPRSEWRTENRQLVMATEPLDVGSVVRAGGGEAWREMPAGTRLGHLHLHVGDIDLASRFYHDALGLDRVVWSYPGALFLSAGGYHHHLGVNTWAAGAAPAADGEARLLEWEIVLPSKEDVERAARSLEEQGFPVERTGEGDLVAPDPWGTPLRLVGERRASAAS